MPASCETRSGSDRPIGRAYPQLPVGQALSGLHNDRVLVWVEFSVTVFQLAPQSVQMNRVIHHRVVDQREAHPLPEFQSMGSASENFFPLKPQM